MTSIPSKTLEVSPGITYMYFHSRAARADLPTLLFLHGFPSTAADFRPQLEHFAARGCGVLAPDLLGYGGTSKPTDPGAYTWRAMAGHVAALLDAEGLVAGGGTAPVVVGIGHDLGSWFLSRLCHLLRPPARLAGLAFLCVGYVPPGGGPFDVEAINRASAAASADGGERFRYWDFFTSDEAPALMGRETEAAVSLMHAAPPGLMAANLGPRGRAREWVAAGRVAPAHSFGGGSGGDDDERSSSRNAYFREKVAAFREGGWTGPTNWYRALRDNLSLGDEEGMAGELEVPVLVVGCGRDEMTAAGPQDEATRPWARAGYRFEVLDAGHWVMLEDAAGTNRLLEEFVDGLS
ncbi:alpha/beta-hydrolase [Colletotrichum zoysiae]|uniref:Alpha/beta-hydrolase n=1 Tax=Colletotrichum zoysiae TaxID=1216348 RepID=A0AAD9M2F8_9PEZI|nr:alpha/beta-hydrolase [Colletotrichum zoysiae]